MTTTRPRVNLTLTDMEQRFVEEIVTEGTAEHDFYMRYLQSEYGLAERSPASLADVVHVLLQVGIDRLEHEAAEISYAAEAAAATDADRAVIAFLSQNHAASAARDEG